jgi:AcrR family transcriptional regulator
VTQARTQIRHERILDAALSVFSTRGYRDAAVDDIALAADTSKGGIYFHFPGKQAIFLALLDRSADVLLGRVVEAVASERDPVAKADAALLAVIRLFGSHRALTRLFLVEASGAGPEFHRRMAGTHARFREFIQRCLDQAIAEDAIAPLDSATASQVWFGALNQVVTDWVLAEAPGPLEERYPALRTLLLQSVGAKVPG